VIRSLLPLLEEGDILTHYFTANPGGVRFAGLLLGFQVFVAAASARTRFRARFRPVFPDGLVHLVPD